MGLNGRVTNLVEVILNPADGGDARNGAVFVRPLPRQRVARKRRQRQELPRLRAFLRRAQSSHVVWHPDERLAACGRRRAYSRIFPRGYVAVGDAGASPHRFTCWRNERRTTLRQRHRDRKKRREYLWAETFGLDWAGFGPMSFVSLGYRTQ